MSGKKLKPRRAIVKISRVVIEKATVTLGREGSVEEIDDAEEIDTDNVEVLKIYSVLSVHP